MVQASALESYDVAASPSSPAVDPRPDEDQLLARGGMADVFLVAAGEEKMVLKRVREDLPEGRLAELLIAEAELTSSLRHPNIVRCHGWFWGDDGHPTMRMEFVSGLDLEALLRACSKRKLVLPMGHRLAVVCGVLRALDHAHRSRDDRGLPLEVVHRDVSPSNVLIGFGGEVKLCDFGIASSRLMPDVPQTRVEGKASYMSPEQAHGWTLDARSDVFACGVLLWELVAGRRMRRRQDGERIEQARRGTIPTLPRRGLPGEEALAAIVHRALAFDAEERYPTARAMMRDIERWCRKHGMMVGESEIGRFMRAHFGAVPERSTVPSPKPIAARATPRSSGEAVATATASMGLRPWWRDLPILVVSAAATFVVMSAVSWIVGF